MTWESRIISDDELAAYATQPLADLPTRVSALIQQQLATWPMLRQATDVLAQVQYREFDVNGARVRAQFNPARIVSTAAKVDTASIQARPCFLCAANLPAEEKGIAFGKDYVVLCNPFPVLEEHLVISERAHTPQAIAPRLGDLLALTQALGSEYFTLYNGPACGASAPDHHHFQACRRKNIPLFREVENWPRDYVLRESELEVFTLRDYRLNILIASGSKMDTIASWFARSLHRLASLTAASTEPLLNLVVTYNPRHWTVYLFPRKKHRPACFYAEGEEKMTISPAGIDLTGVLVVPDPRHFARLTALQIAQIYEEITLAPQA